MSCPGTHSQRGKAGTSTLISRLPLLWLFSPLTGWGRWLSEQVPDLLGPDLPTSSAVSKGCLSLARPPEVLLVLRHQAWTGA